MIEAAFYIVAVFICGAFFGGIFVTRSIAKITADEYAEVIDGIVNVKLNGCLPGVVGEISYFNYKGRKYAATLITEDIEQRLVKKVNETTDASYWETTEGK